jgi:hypothetical protein
MLPATCLRTTMACLPTCPRTSLRQPAR